MLTESSTITPSYSNPFEEAAKAYQSMFCNQYNIVWDRDSNNVIIHATDGIKSMRIITFDQKEDFIDYTNRLKNLDEFERYQETGGRSLHFMSAILNCKKIGGINPIIAKDKDLITLKNSSGQVISHLTTNEFMNQYGTVSHIVETPENPSSIWSRILSIFRSKI